MQTRHAVRRFRMADLDRILEIESASFGQDAYDRNLFAEYARHCGELFLVAGQRGKVSGYVIAFLRHEKAELVSIAVDPAARGKGAASALLKSTLRRLKWRGATRVGLMVRVSNKSARAFYHRFGFAQVRRVKRYYEDGEDDG